MNIMNLQLWRLIENLSNLQIKPLQRNDFMNIRGSTMSAETPEHQWVFQRVMSARRSWATQQNNGKNGSLSQQAAGTKFSTPYKNMRKGLIRLILNLRYLNFGPIPTIVFRASRSRWARHQLPDPSCSRRGSLTQKAHLDVLWSVMPQPAAIESRRILKGLPFAVENGWKCHITHITNET